MHFYENRIRLWADIISVDGHCDTIRVIFLFIKLRVYVYAYISVVENLSLRTYRNITNYTTCYLSPQLIKNFFIWEFWNVNFIVYYVCYEKKSKIKILPLNLENQKTKIKIKIFKLNIQKSHEYFPIITLHHKRICTFIYYNWDLHKYKNISQCYISDRCQLKTLKHWYLVLRNT